MTITLTGLALAFTFCSPLPHPSFRTLLHSAILELPHEQKMSSTMTELTPVLPDPVRRRRLYVLCLAIPGNTQLTSPFVIIHFFTVWGDLLWSSEAASGTFFLIVGHIDAMDTLQCIGT